MFVEYVGIFIINYSIRLYNNHFYRMPFEACCPGVKYPGDDCPPVWGSCGHAFHMQW